MEETVKKKCTKCGEIKDKSEFNKDKQKNDGYCPSCRVCRKKSAFLYRNKYKNKIRLGKKKYSLKNRSKIAYRQKKWYDLNRENILEKKRIYGKKHRKERNIWVKEHVKRFPEKEKSRRLLVRYGITLVEKIKIYQEQQKRCAICKKNIPLFGRDGSVDHDHKKVKRAAVRGILCRKCNERLLGEYEFIREKLSSDQRWPFLENYLNNPPAQQWLTNLN